ncbi:MAG TPA: MATE family efflux transporter [Steroidobacteraceae bacterium]|nr:MATE family efflux transporter [Steroidobacteraceae bacterium]
MQTLTEQSHVPVSPGLPARRFDAYGRAHVDLRAVAALALPLLANSAVQTVLNLTDLWYIAHISTRAVAAVGAVNWLVLVVVLALSGVGMAVQTLSAQAFGAGRRARAGQAVWTMLWATLCVTPLFVLAALAGHALLAPFGLDPGIRDLALEFWVRRVAGAPLGAALWGVLGFFNGIGRPRATLQVSALVALANAVLNALFIFDLHWGVAGSAWASNAAQGIGLALALARFLRAPYRRSFRTHLTYRLRPRALLEQLRLGLPMGLTYASDLLAISLFLLMQVRLSTVDGAASQIVFVITSIAYMPGIGIALAGTTLVGQSIGAGDRRWAMRLGTSVIVLAAVCMGGIGVLLAFAGPWVLPFWARSDDPQAPAMLARAAQILWLAAAYQFFDGLNVGSALCLRGAGDATVPALLVLACSSLVFMPVAHALSFAPGAGWVTFLPQLGWGWLGGWLAVILYIMVLGSALFVRWRSGAWQRIQI